MNYALGYALHLKDLFKTFNIKRLKLKTKICEQLLGNRHKEIIAFKIMKYCIKLVLDDVIDNNATFHLPTNKKEVCIKMKRTEGEEFAKARRNGKWQDVDFLFSNFSGYQMVLRFQQGEIKREFPIYVDNSNKDRITQHTNNGKQYF